MQLATVTDDWRAARVVRSLEPHAGSSSPMIDSDEKRPLTCPVSEAFLRTPRLRIEKLAKNEVELTGIRILGTCRLCNKG
jgi:hypothetical protein